jgi:uncharacterized membrane protein
MLIFLIIISIVLLILIVIAVLCIIDWIKWEELHKELTKEKRYIFWKGEDEEDEC